LGRTRLFPSGGRRELIVLIDRDTDLELIGHDASPATNYGHAIVSRLEDAIAFAERARFPDHGLIVMGCDGERAAPERLLIKNIVDEAALDVRSDGLLTFAPQP
jgi:hypothetical protein